MAHETDFGGWRRAARALRSAGVSPEAVAWTAGEQAQLGEEVTVADGDCAFPVPREFVELARDVVLHRDPARFALLYRLLWRLRNEPGLMHVATDADVARAMELRKGVERAAYRLKQYVRFREVEDDKGAAYVAWIEPEHRVLARAAPFFVERFANMRWAVLTPDACASWDGEALSFSPGVSREEAPADDAQEDVWRAYFAATFNPARLKVKAMTAQMPKSLWRNLPEAQVIPRLIQQAATRAETMVGAPHTEPSKRTARAVARSVRDGTFDDAYVPTSVADVWTAVQACRRCDLWRDATQGVAGEGPARAALMFVGEQPGDQEDLAGKPFIGPAGQMFDKALAEAGVPRAETYVTNAVKHFKHEPRGKRRIHAKPNVGEIRACRWWLENERRLVRPKVIVALGATAGQAVFDRPVSVSKDRGHPFDLGDAQGLITVHPAYLLRLPSHEDRARAWKLFVADLRAAWELAGGSHAEGASSGA
nr:UdgX family uracil-DNA binding protein [Caulobacter sp. 17J80-11]